jgi:hypothetical protein
MRFKSELKPVTAAQLKKALHNAVSYEIRYEKLIDYLSTFKLIFGKVD